MRIEQNFSLEAYNTFHLKVKTRWFMEYDSEADLEKILHDEYYQECFSLHIGSGSNLLFLNDINGIILHSQIKGIEKVKEDDEYVYLRVGAAEKWDELVDFTVKKGWSGAECLSLIPGEVGAAAVQNIGAYGAEIKDLVENVEAWSKFSFQKKIFSNQDCHYAYRYSYFKDEQSEPYIVTYVTLRFVKHPVFNIRHGALHDALDGKELTPSVVRDAVIAIRQSKLPDPDVLGNAGSFFMNPMIPADQYASLLKQYPDIPCYPSEPGKVKVPAGWLIEHCGLKGKNYGNVGIYEKQALVLVNLGGATGDEIALFAESVRNLVQDRFGIDLRPEVKYVG